MLTATWDCQTEHVWGREKYNKYNEKAIYSFLAPYWMRAPVLISSELKKKLLKIKLHAGDVGQLIESLSGMQRTPSLVPSNMQTMPALL